MDKSELLSSLEASRKNLLAALDGLSDDELTRPGAAGDWSVKDLLSHLTAWEAEMVAMLAREVRQGKKPKHADITGAKIQELNSQWHAEYKDRPLQRVRADFSDVRKQILRQVSALSDNDFADPNRYPWLKGRSFADWIRTYTSEHEAEHAEQIAHWREKR
ncbi:MAG: ClbS/DfsB family four-helix bundle protein [Chloroflexi bacterium]|nr:ClbS/DfsB family four-helix bundle protein [Chloroflexota bacterium]